MKTIATSYLQSKNLRNVGYAMLLPRYKVCTMDVKYLKNKQVMFLVCKAKHEKWNYQIFCIDFRGIGIVRRIRSPILSKERVNPIRSHVFLYLIQLS
jgi:hypothetical protein